MHNKTQQPERKERKLKERFLAAACLIAHPALLLADPPPAALTEGIRAKSPTTVHPIASYPARFALPKRHRAAATVGDKGSHIQQVTDSDASTAMAAYAFSGPSSPEEYLVYLRELEEVPFFTLWEGSSSRIFFGLDDDHHPGLHFSPRRD
ncbi:MAG: hypothetical protein WBN31_09310 [Gammaproteobacteria bacterium]